MPFVQKAFWALSAVGGLWAIFLGALLNPHVQRFALYANYFHTAWWDDLDDGQAFGFMANQVRPFNISNPTGDNLYAWHVLPLSLYASRERELLQEHEKPPESYKDSLAFKYVTEDPDSHVVISFHGNAGHLANGWRADNYRSITSASRVHVIAFDYRGFGRSPGSPTEDGLVSDGATVLDFVLNTLKIPPQRVTILAQSLGTAVASAVTLQYHDPDESCRLLPSCELDCGDDCPAKSPSDGDFASVILTAPFTSIPVLMKTYRIFGVIPVLSPLRFYPWIEDFIVQHIADTWDTKARIEALVESYTSSSGANNARPRKLNLHLVHAKNDFEIPWRHSQALFLTAANASQNNDAVAVQDFGRLTWEWGVEEPHLMSEGKVVLEIVPYGGHNKVTASAPVAVAVMRSLGKA